MALESATTINQLNPLFPVATDGLAQADDHMRLIKSTIQNTFPNITGAITATQAEMNKMDGVTASTSELNTLTGITASTAELNKLDGYTGSATNLNILSGSGVTPTEFSYLDGVTSNLQTQLNSKQPNVTGAATTIMSSNLTANQVLVSDGSGKVAVSGVIDTTELGYLNGVTSSIQSQLNSLSSSVSGISTDLVNDTSPQLGGQLDTNGQSIAFGSWTISIDGSNNLSFAYGGDVKLRITAAGALDVEDDITAFSGI